MLIRLDKRRRGHSERRRHEGDDRARYGHTGAHASHLDRLIH
jgi:hypothetical protein